MKITKQPKASSTSDMLNAFEAKLAEMSVDSCSDIKGSEDLHSEEVPIEEADYHDMWQDVGGGFGDPGEFYSLADIKGYWNDQREYDPCVNIYNTFEAWWEDTKHNYMKKA